MDTATIIEKFENAVAKCREHQALKVRRLQLDDQIRTLETERAAVQEQLWNSSDNRWGQMAQLILDAAGVE